MMYNWNEFEPFCFPSLYIFLFTCINRRNNNVSHFSCLSVFFFLFLCVLLFGPGDAVPSLWHAGGAVVTPRQM
jgi:hypothetical protein